MPDALTAINLRATPQSEQADPRQVKNNAGGNTFTIDDTKRLRRFLVLGTEGGTYYTSETALTQDNATVVLDFARNRATELVDELVTLSVQGRAPRQNPILFALAAAASLGDTEGRQAALAAITAVVRTGTHLFQFATYAQQFRGWGRGLRRAVADWYLTKPVDDTAYQVVKYRQRDGWTHRDLLRLAHPTADTPERAVLFDWICGRNTEQTAGLITAFEAAQRATTVTEWCSLIDANPALSWEMLPDEALTKPAVWEALLTNGIPQTALMRQLPRLTRIGLLKPMSSTLRTVSAQIVDPERIRKARLHPVNVLVAARTYAAGHSYRGDSTWTPSAVVVDALDTAFYAAFGIVTPANKRTLLALDISSSMSMAQIAGMPITPREASAALALVTAATEPDHVIVGFSDQLRQLPISSRQRIDDAIQSVSNLPFGRTDCALPMVAAMNMGLEVDTFQIYTDNETWFGNIHPHQALRQYRDKTGIDARLAVVAMTPTQFSIADPTDTNMLDVAGFDSAVPNLLSAFSRREV